MKYFGTDGIRGVANREVTPEIAYRVGRYLGNSEETKKMIILGDDSRISAELLELAFISGVLSAGGDVYKVGTAPTPVIPFLINKLNADYGVIISASHNPVVDNGIKIVGKDCYKISSDVEQEIELFIDASSDDLYRATAGRIGKIYDISEMVHDYANYIVSTIHTNLNGLKVVIDCANGAASYVAKDVFEQLKADVIYIHNNPTGLNINDNCGSTHPETISQAVIDNDADFGISLDGDADRIICVDSRGNVIDGDVLMYLLAVKLKEQDVLWNDKIAVTKMSNMGLFKALKENLNVDVVVTEVGDKYISRALHEHSLALGGEVSGHIILSEYSKCGDGLLIGLHLLEFLYTNNYSFNNIGETISLFPSKLVNVKVQDKDYIMTNRSVLQEIKRVENILEGSGRVFVRASGTESIIRVLVECEDQKDCEQFADSIVSTMKKENGDE